MTGNRDCDTGQRLQLDAEVTIEKQLVLNNYTTSIQYKMATVASDFGLTTDGIFVRAPRLTVDDIDELLSDGDADLIEEFEDAWKEFLLSRPGTLPPGQKIKNFRNIQTRMNEIEAKKQNVCLELQRQLEFFASSKDKIEEKFSSQKKEAMLQQKSVVGALQQDIDNIVNADKLLSEVLPWKHYFDSLESNTLAANGGKTTSSEKSGQSQVMRPSDEALYLANIQHDEASEAELLRAHRIDNSLLKAKSVMMKREAERLEKNLLADRVLAKILMDNDVWAAMASSKN